MSRLPSIPLLYVCVALFIACTGTENSGAASLLESPSPVVRDVADVYDSASALQLYPIRRVCFERDDAACAYQRLTSAHLLRNGNIILADESSVREVDSDSRVVRTFGRQGMGPGEMRVVGGVTIAPDGIVNVLDQFGFRIVQFDSVAKHVQTVNAVLSRGTADMDLVAGKYIQVVLGSAPNVGDPVEGRIIARSVSGDSSTLATFAAHARSTTGDYVELGTPFAPQVRWGVDGESTAVVSYGLPFEFVIFKGGKPQVRVRSDVPPLAVTAGARDSAVQRLRNPGGRPSNAPGYNTQADAKVAMIPSHRPSILRIELTENDLIWLRSAVPVTSRSADPKVRWDVFDTDGGRRGYVLLQPSAAIAESKGDTLLVIERDASDRHYVAVYRLDVQLPTVGTVRSR